MNRSDKQIVDAFRKIAEIAASTADSISNRRNIRSAEVDENHSDHGPDCGCIIKRLPERLLIRAAATAAKLSPMNAPVSSAYAPILSEDVLDPQKIAILTTKYWGPSPRTLTVSFLDGGAADLRSRIVQHMNAWNVGIDFRETSDVGHVRITRGGDGYWSYLGTDILHIPKDRPTMNLQDFSMNTPESEYRRVVRHETGHTLGFPHEHMRREIVDRIDPEKAYAYFLSTQGWDRRTVDAQVRTALDQRTIMGTAPEEDSEMCYFLPGSIMRDGRPVAGGKDITPNDYAFAAKMYPKSASAAASPNINNDNWGTDDDSNVVDHGMLAA